MKYSFLPLACLFFLAPPVFAGVTAESIIKAVSTAKIMAPGYTVNAVVYSATHEVIVSTYANNSSKNISNDCKIDAVLIARKVLDLDAQTVRVRVRFYQWDQAAYQQVVVTKAEILAFSSGSIKKDDLLASLEVVSVSTGKSVAAQSGANRTTGMGSRLQSFAATAGTSAQSSGTATYSSKGVSFSYPSSYREKPMQNQYGDFVELWRDRTAWQSIIFRQQDRESPESVFDDDNRLYFSLHMHRILRQENIVTGRNHSIPALVVAIKDEENPKEPDRWEMHVYFGQQHNIYSISARYCGADAAIVHADLKQILDSMRI